MLEPETARKIRKTKYQPISTNSVADATFGNKNNKRTNTAYTIINTNTPISFEEKEFPPMPVTSKTKEKTKVFMGRYITKNGSISLNTIPNQLPIFSKSEVILLYIIYTCLSESITRNVANILSIHILVIIIIAAGNKIKYQKYNTTFLLLKYCQPISIYKVY